MILTNRPELKALGRDNAEGDHPHRGTSTPNLLSRFESYAQLNAQKHLQSPYQDHRIPLAMCCRDGGLLPKASSNYSSWPLLQPRSLRWFRPSSCQYRSFTHNVKISSVHSIIEYLDSPFRKILMPKCLLKKLEENCLNYALQINPSDNYTVQLR